MIFKAILDAFLAVCESFDPATAGRRAAARPYR